ncbi:MAG: hypothetical protein BJ554DRAFT_270 [Olpidium bornovanus]|uniref:Uncharacterized protein n=1 Tax=Olpidium bornovanus TaxID=278681 RepID=A0A8H8DI98_9FUNG|nr:MAG: hypothetical protein BJ554DRAFT_270 [Olpidium bornovanus]
MFTQFATSQMNHKVIETLVLQAQKAVRENVTVGRDAKRRKPKPLRNNLKPPKVKQAERTTGWQVPIDTLFLP